MNKQKKASISILYDYIDCHYGFKLYRIPYVSTIKT